MAFMSSMSDPHYSWEKQSVRGDGSAGHQRKYPIAFRAQWRCHFIKLGAMPCQVGYKLPHCPCSWRLLPTGPLCMFVRFCGRQRMWVAFPLAFLTHSCLSNHSGISYFVKAFMNFSISIILPWLLLFCPGFPLLQHNSFDMGNRERHHFSVLTESVAACAFSDLIFLLNTFSHSPSQVNWR